MSIFEPTLLKCPRCATPVRFQSVHSVNGGRRPDQRLAILQGAFQRETCPSCGASFRLDPAFVYVDVPRGQWLAVRPVPEIEHWPEQERETQALFDTAYGEQAPALAREIGTGLKPRVLFGWSALREKLIAGEAGVDDVTLELLKMAVLRNMHEVPFSADSSPRLMDFDAERLLIGWVRNADDAVGELRWVSREVYVDIADDAGRGSDSQWVDVRGELEAALFVDVDRWLVTPVEPQAATA